LQGGKILKYLLSLLAVDLRSRGSCCLSASLQRHFSMESPQSSSHWPHNSSPFFESLVPFQRLSYIMSSPYLSSVSLSSLLGCLYYHHNYDIAPVPRLDFLFHVSHSYPACSFLLFIPPLVPRPSCRDFLLCRICCSFIAFDFAPHFSYYVSLPPKVVFMLYSEFLDSNILEEMSICLATTININPLLTALVRY
jgi:hypothetical protein